MSNNKVVSCASTPSKSSTKHVVTHNTESTITSQQSQSQQQQRGRKLDRSNIISNNNTNTMKRETSPLSTCVSSVVPFKEVFELTRQIDSGSYSVVYEAIHRISGERYAVKIYDRTKFPSVEEDLAVYNEVSNLRYVERRRYAKDLFKEQQRQQRCSSSKRSSSKRRSYDIIRLIDFFEDTSKFFLVLELCTGGDLFTKVVERHYYSEYEARYLAKCLLESIKYMHECGIAHRDLKPDNLLLAKNGNDVHVKIADFGFSAKTRIGGMNIPLTQRCGTPAYVAPEVLRGGPYDERVDMWSAGCILYFVLGGYPAFVDDKPKALFHKILNGDYEFHEDDWCHVSNDAKSLVSGLLTLDVNKRLTASQALKHPWLCSSSNSSSSRRPMNNVVAPQHPQGLNNNMVVPLDHNNHLFNNIATNIATINCQQRLSNVTLQQQHDEKLDSGQSSSEC